MRTHGIKEICEKESVVFRDAADLKVSWINQSSELLGGVVGRFTKAKRTMIPNHGIFKVDPMVT